MVPAHRSPPSESRSPTLMQASTIAQMMPSAAPESPMGWSTRGIWWLSTLGWALFVVGLWLPTYFYDWSRTQGADYAPYGIKGIYLAYLALLAGLALAVVFLFVPTQRPASWTASAPSEWIEQRLQMIGSKVRIYWSLSLVGLALMVIGLVFSAYVSLTWLNHPDAPDFTLAGTAVSFETWRAMAWALVGVGMVVALACYFRIGGYREATFAARVASTRAPGGQTYVSGAPMVSTPVGVNAPQIEALMRRIDGMLANLPEEVVGEFSKSPEADTYLKILGNAKAEALGPKKKSKK